MQLSPMLTLNALTRTPTRKCDFFARKVLMYSFLKIANTVNNVMNNEP